MAKKQNSRRAFGSIIHKGKRHYAQYTGPDLVRHTPGRSFPTAMDAEGWLAAERRLIDLGTWTPPAARKQAAERDATTVGEWMDKFHDILAHRPKPPKPSTMQNYKRVTRNRITSPLAPGADDPDVAGFKDLRLVDVTKADVFRWWDGLQRNYPDATTINQQAYKRVKAAFAEAVRREMLTVNPVDVRDAGKRVEPEAKHLPEDWELAAIIKAMPAQYRALAVLTLHHGLRIGEALALEQRHVQVEWLPVPYMPRVTVKVEQNAQRLADEDGHTSMFVQEPKTTAGERTVPIMAVDVPVIVAHLAVHAPTTDSRVETWRGPKDLRLFTATSRGSIVMDTSLRSVMDRAKVRAGVTSDITPHSGRDWLITRMAENGSHLKLIGKVLGQRDVQTLLGVYLLVREGAAEVAMEQVNASVLQR